MVSRGGSGTTWSARVTVSWSMMSRATVLPSALSSRVTLTEPDAVAMGSRARGLASFRIWSRTGPAGRSAASRGRVGRKEMTGCSAWGVSSLDRSRRPPRFLCSYSRIRPARLSRQSKVSSQVCWRAPLPGAPGSVTTPNTSPRASRTAETESCPPMSPVSASSWNPRRSGVMKSGSPFGESYCHSPYDLYTPGSGRRPGHAGGGQDVGGAGHARLGAGPGDRGGARGGRGSYCVGGGDAGGQGYGEGADERVARPNGVDRADAETVDDLGVVRAFRAGAAGQGGAVRAGGDHRVAGAAADQLGGGLGGVGQAGYLTAEDRGRFGLVDDQPVHFFAERGDQGWGVVRGGGEVHDGAAVVSQGPGDGLGGDLGADDQDVAVGGDGRVDVGPADVVVGAGRDDDEVLGGLVDGDQGQAGGSAGFGPRGAGVDAFGTQVG